MNNRLQKKCIIAATSFHLLLVLILLVGPAFFSPDSKRERTQEIDFVPAILIDDILQGGGSPKGGQTAPPPQKNDPPPVVAKPPEPVKHQEAPPQDKTPEPPKQPLKPAKPVDQDDAIDPTPPKPQKHEVKVNLTEVKNNATTKPKPQNSTRTANSDSAADKNLANASTHR